MALLGCVRSIGSIWIWRMTLGGMLHFIWLRRGLWSIDFMVVGMALTAEQQGMTVFESVLGYEMNNIPHCVSSGLCVLFSCSWQDPHNMKRVALQFEQVKSCSPRRRELKRRILAQHNMRAVGMVFDIGFT